MKKKKNTLPFIKLIALLILAASLLSLQIFAQKAEPQKLNTQELNSILEKTGAYCERLKNAVFHFICTETIHEKIVKSIQKVAEKNRELLDFLDKRSLYQFNYVPYSSKDPNLHDGAYRSIRKNVFIHEYQITRKGDRIHEERVLTKINNKKIKPGHPGIKTFLYPYRNAVAPIYLFSIENQSKYHYQLLGTKKVLGKKTYVLEVTPKELSEPTTNEREEKKETQKLVIAWIDSLDFSIVKLQVFPGAIKGYDSLFSNEKEKMWGLKISDVHYFGYARQGIRYPTKTEISLSYLSIPATRSEQDDKSIFKTSTKVDTVINYNKYFFYDVSVDDPIYETPEMDINE